jgi:outer membrane protein assembly factor BamE (lipoprotein component of BamABCDE complex)
LHAPRWRYTETLSKSQERAMRLALILTAASLAAAGCAPVMRTHGYVPNEIAEQLVQPQVDTRETVRARLGNPSTTGVFEDTWYYISATREDFAYFRPKITARRIIAVDFDETGRVSNVDEYDVEDGNQIRLVGRETPTRGREVSLLEQVFGSIGAVNPNQLPGYRDEMPDSAGGPDPYGR